VDLQLETGFFFLNNKAIGVGHAMNYSDAARRHSNK
jgi:hypothetical protein